MKTCPHCGVEVQIRKLRHQGLFKSYRICQHCSEKFDVDRDTKRRQALSMIALFISLLFTWRLRYQSDEWLIPALISYACFGLTIYQGNKHLVFVPYPQKQNNRDETDSPSESES
jgi:hypothetical protein